MENTSEKIKKNLGSVVKVISYAIEKDKNSLIELLRKNGADIKTDISKSKLRAILVSALRESETFRTEFRNWVLERSGTIRNPKAQNILASLPKPPKKQIFKPKSIETVSYTNFTGVDGLISGATSQSNEIITNNNDNNEEGFWNVDLNTILDFAKDGINNYAIIVKSKSEESVMNNALAIEQSSTTTFDPKSTSNSKTKYIVLGVAAVAVIGFSIWYFKGKK